MSSTTTDQELRSAISSLQSPVSELESLLPLLCGPLDCLGLLPPRFQRYNTRPVISGNALKSIGHLQTVLLERVIPTWEWVLSKEHGSLLDQFFCPDLFSSASATAGNVALSAYSSILALPLTDYSMRILVRLNREYPVDRLYPVIFPTYSRSTHQTLVWEDYVRNVLAVPSKVANALAGKSVIPPSLENGEYFASFCTRFEILVSGIALKDDLSAITYLITKMVNTGLFPPSVPISRSQPSFFVTALPTIRGRSEGGSRDAAMWPSLFKSLPSNLAQQAVVISLFSSLPEIPGSVPSVDQGPFIRRHAAVLQQILGKVTPVEPVLWDCVCSIVLGREWSEEKGRVFVCWIAGNGPDVDRKALGEFLLKVSDLWSTPDHIKHSLTSRHRYVTTLLLVAISYFPTMAPELTFLALSSSLISGIGKYIGLLDQLTRRIGMLVAEVVAQRSGKKLDFGDWDGDDISQVWVRRLRELIKTRDVDVSIAEDDFLPSIRGGQAEADTKQTLSKPNTDTKRLTVKQEYDSDDSLTGYASPSSSRSVSPTHSELEEIEKDPTLGVGVKKIPRPVYLAQLGELVRSTSGLKSQQENQTADKVEVALTFGEELVRKKRNYGTELEENAINLAYGFVGLQDNYNLEGFDENRQKIVNALVACCPRKSAPTLIEEFYKNQYSVDQRYVILKALALGARELASLDIPGRLAPKGNIEFPSKQLPLHLHRKYLTAGGQSVEQILDDIGHQAIENGTGSQVQNAPELVRERRLRVQQPRKVTEISKKEPIHLHSRNSPETSFTEVAAEFFIMPLINRFWLFLRDEQTREERTANREPINQYRGAGTGLILNTLVLAHFVGTLTVLVHASQNAPEWLAIIAPEALEVAVSLGTRPMSRQEDADADADEQDTQAGKEAALLTNSLELALTTLDGCLRIDGGRSICLDHTTLVLGAGEWASRIFEALEKGLRFKGESGVQEVRIRRAAAGVLLKVDELKSKWRRSMVDIR